VPIQTTVPPNLAFRNRTFNTILEARNVVLITSEESFLYRYNGEMIVITGSDAPTRKFIAQAKAGQKDAKLSITLVPEQNSLYNSRFNTFLLHHHPPR